jgi:hypothetical protein
MFVNEPLPGGKPVPRPEVITKGLDSFKRTLYIQGCTSSFDCLPGVSKQTGRKDIPAEVEGVSTPITHFTN